MKTFRAEPLFQVRDWLARSRQGAGPGRVLSFSVPDPDLKAGTFAGTVFTHEGITCRHRSHKTWMDLAEGLDLRYLTPQLGKQGFLILRFQVLDNSKNLHGYQADQPDEKYGLDSPFASIDKLEEPCFLDDYLQALEMAALQRGDRVLDLGVNKADELTALSLVYGPDFATGLAVTGIDHAASALAEARRRYPLPNYQFACRDLADYPSLELARYHLLVSIGTLQSPSFDGKDLFSKILKNHLEQRAAVILGWPNARYLDGEIKYGARVKNYRKPELSLLVKDLSFYRRSLNKRGFRVTLTGKYYLFLTAVRCG